jgi:hypothetical protein
LIETQKQCHELTDRQPSKIIENITLREYGTSKNADITSVCRCGKCKAPGRMKES